MSGPVVGRRAFVLGALALPLAACAPGVAKWASDAEVERVRLRGPGPAFLGLVTVKTEETGDGVHSALMIQASETVLFDPFGGWVDRATVGRVAERNDVLHGFGPEAQARYLAYQAEDGYFYTLQKVEVADALAETVLQRAKVAGPVAQGRCAISVCGLLEGQPGFEGIGRVWLPRSLEARFGRVAGIVGTEVRGTPA